MSAQCRLQFDFQINQNGMRLIRTRFFVPETSKLQFNALA